MTIDFDKSHEIDEEGLAVTNGDGQPLLYLTTLLGDPTGTPAPINTWVFAQSTQIIYKKVGPLDTDWEEFKPTAQSIQILFYFSSTKKNTTSNRWVQNHFVTTPTLLAGDYQLDLTALISQTIKQRQVGYNVQWRIGTSGSWTDIIKVFEGVAVADSFVPRTAFTKITIPTDSVIQIRDRFGQTDDGGTGKIKDSGFRLTKIEDIS